MIEVIEPKGIPYYETECYECKSKLRYTRADVSLLHITCPVCGMSIHVIPSEGHEAGLYPYVDERTRASLNTIKETD